MGRYIVRRLLWVVVLVFAVVTITFLIFSVLPSGADPARLRAGRSPNPRLVEGTPAALQAAGIGSADWAEEPGSAAAPDLPVRGASSGSLNIRETSPTDGS